MMGALRQCFSELMSPLFVAPGRCWMLPEGLLPEGLLPEPAERQKALYGRYSVKHISPNLQETQLRAGAIAAGYLPPHTCVGDGTLAPPGAGVPPFTKSNPAKASTPLALRGGDEFLPGSTIYVRDLTRLATSVVETATLVSQGTLIYDVSQGGYLNLSSPFVAYLMARARVSRTFMGVLMNWFC